MQLTDTLDFLLPPFQRITWASAALKAEWEPVLTDLRQAIDDFFITPRAAALAPIRITHVPADELYGYKKRVYANGFFAEHCPTLPLALRLAFGLLPVADCVPVITGTRQTVTDFIASMHHYEKAAAIARLPVGLLRFWEGHAARGFTETAWAYMAYSRGAIERSMTYENNLLNPCWQRLGIAALPWQPVNPNCTASKKMALKLQTLAKKLLPQRLFNAWYEILSWPVEWTALHGIAEVKTPLFKMIYNTTATGGVYTLRLSSNTYPVNGLNGRLFPYRQPAIPFFSGSKKFKEGVAHIITN